MGNTTVEPTTSETVYSMVPMEHLKIMLFSVGLMGLGSHPEKKYREWTREKLDFVR